MKYQIIDHGVEGSQYFQGCGTSFTEYDNVVTGIGDSYSAALDDALDSMAQSIAGGIPDELEEEASTADETITVPTSDEEDESELWHHVSIRWTDEQTYTLIVGNLGQVYTGNSRKDADKVFAEYVFASQSTFGRAMGEDVTLMENGEPVNEYRDIDAGKVEDSE